MIDYTKYINALRKCANEHKNDRTFMGYVVVSDLCRDTADLLESLVQEPKTKRNIPRKTLEKILDEAYEDFGKLEAGDSYIIIHGKRVSTDTAYAMEGIELFIDFVTGRAEHKTYDE